MNSKRVNEAIPDVINAIKSSEVLLTNEEVPKELNGDISSLAASIRQSGLLVALSFYSEKPGDNNRDKIKIRRNAMLDVILHVCKTKSIIKEDLAFEGQSYDLLQTAMKYIDPNYNVGNSSVSNRFNSNYVREQLLVEEINIATVALKMGIRVFKKTQNG